MTIHKVIFRVSGNEDLIRGYSPRLGIESVVKPYQAENNLFDVMFRASDMNPCLSERLLMDDINTEVERMKFLFGRKGEKLKDGGDRMRDGPFKKQLFPKSPPLKDDKTYIRFRTFEDDKELESLDEFKSKAEVIYGDENQVSGDKSIREINEAYCKAKKKYLSLIDRG